MQTNRSTFQLFTIHCWKSNNPNNEPYVRFTKKNKEISDVFIFYALIYVYQIGLIMRWIGPTAFQFIQQNNERFKKYKVEFPHPQFPAVPPNSMIHLSDPAIYQLFKEIVPNEDPSWITFKESAIHNLKTVTAQHKQCKKNLFDKSKESSDEFSTADAVFEYIQPVQQKGVDASSFHNTLLQLFDGKFIPEDTPNIVTDMYINPGDKSKPDLDTLRYRSDISATTIAYKGIKTLLTSMHKGKYEDEYNKCFRAFNDIGDITIRYIQDDILKHNRIGHAVIFFIEFIKYQGTFDLPKR